MTAEVLAVVEVPDTLLGCAALFTGRASVRVENPPALDLQAAACAVEYFSMAPRHTLRAAGAVIEALAPGLSSDRFRHELNLILFVHGCSILSPWPQKCRG
jgi:hypothetical protein